MLPLGDVLAQSLTSHRFNQNSWIRLSRSLSLVFLLSSLTRSFAFSISSLLLHGWAVMTHEDEVREPLLWCSTKDVVVEASRGERFQFRPFTGSETSARIGRCLNLSKREKASGRRGEVHSWPRTVSVWTKHIPKLHKP